MRVELGEHVFVAGRTGSGKTFLVKHYLRALSPVLVLDVKKSLTWNREDDILFTDRLSKVLQSKNKVVVYQPHWRELNLEYYDKFFEYAYSLTSASLWVDELMGVASSMKYPPFLKACLTRGRERKLSVWSVTQRPSLIPLISMSEATHMFIFDLNMKEDRKRISEIAGEEEFMERPGKYQFWYFNTVRGEIPVKARLVEGGGG